MRLAGPRPRRDAPFISTRPGSLHALMLAASVTLLVASDHEHRAFLHPSEAVRRCTGGVVTMARLSSFLARRPHDSSPRGVDLVARDLWKLTAITIVVNAVLAVGAYWVFSFIRIGPLQLLFIWFPCICARHFPTSSSRVCAHSGHRAPITKTAPSSFGATTSPSRSSRPDFCSTLSRAARWPRK